MPDLSIQSIKRNRQALLFHGVSRLIGNNYELFVKPLCATSVKSETNKLYKKSLRILIQMC